MSESKSAKIRSMVLIYCKVPFKNSPRQTG